MQNIRSNRGITLIELMVTVSIVAILASIVYPSYKNSVLKSGRTDGKLALMTTAEDLEKCFTRFNAYNTTTCAVNASATAITAHDSPNRKYRITGAVTATTFALTATPQGGQASDTACGTLTLDSTNTRGPVSTSCW